MESIDPYKLPPIDPAVDDPIDNTLKDGLKFRRLRHPSTEHFGPHFAFGHLPPHLQEVSRRFAQLAQFLVNSQKDGPELTVALRKLWESKNCAVIHAGFIADAEKAKNQVEP